LQFSGIEVWKVAVENQNMSVLGWLLLKSDKKCVSCSGLNLLLGDPDMTR
jgi:hypothetical protein